MIRGRRKLALPEPPRGTGLGGLSPVCHQPTLSSLLQPPSSVLGSTRGSDAPCPQDDTLCLRTLLLNWPRCVMGRGLKVHCGGRKPMTLTVALWIPPQRRLTGPQERRQVRSEVLPAHRTDTLLWHGQALVPKPKLPHDDKWRHPALGGRESHQPQGTPMLETLAPRPPAQMPRRGRQGCPSRVTIQPDFK